MQYIKYLNSYDIFNYEIIISYNSDLLIVINQAIVITSLYIKNQSDTFGKT